MVIIRIVPESTRWLITKHRYEEASILISKAAEMNGKIVPDHLISIGSVKVHYIYVNFMQINAITILTNRM